MRVEVQKWGNSGAIRLPSHVLKEVSVALGDRLELTTEAGRIVLSPTTREYRLDELVAGINRKNRHELVDFGVPVGREVW